MTRIILNSLPSHKRRAVSATRITKLVKLIVSFEIGFFASLTSDENFDAIRRFHKSLGSRIAPNT